MTKYYSRMFLHFVDKLKINKYTVTWLFVAAFGSQICTIDLRAYGLEDVDFGDSYAKANNISFGNIQRGFNILEILVRFQ